MREMVIYKYTIPVDGASHIINIPGDLYDVVQVACLRSGFVTFWAFIELANIESRNTFKVVGTGEKFDGEMWAPVGSCLDGLFVWHLIIAHGESD